jgi:hypothetical protein
MHSLFKGNHRRVQGYHLLMIKQNARTMDTKAPKLRGNMVQTTKSQTPLGNNGSKRFELMSGNLTIGTSKQMAMMKQMVLILFCDIFGHSCSYIHMHVLRSNHTSPDQVWTTTQNTYVTVVQPPVIN